MGLGSRVKRIFGKEPKAYTPGPQETDSLQGSQQESVGGSAKTPDESNKPTSQKREEPQGVQDQGKTAISSEQVRSATGPGIVLSNPRIVGPPRDASEVELGFQQIHHALDLQTAFEYRPLKEGQIRLLKIVLPGVYPWCSLEDHYIDNAPPYAAMSYAWDRPIMTRAMFCQNYNENMASFSISEHILEALNNLHGYVPHENKIWIDGICINQKDPVEKAAQVALIPQIFSRAQEVFCWLGKQADQSDLVISNLPRLAEEVERASLQGTLSIQSEDAALWVATAKLFRRPWFHRLWVVPEILMARELTLVCGDKAVLWNGFRGAVAKLTTISLNFAEPGLAEHFDSGARGIFELGRWRDKKQGLVETVFDIHEFIRLLLWSCERQVTEPVDRVWALAGLAPPHMRQAVAHLTDYSDHARSNFHNTYKAVVRAFLLQDERLSLLALVALLPRHPNVPSWCPIFFHSLEMRQEGIVQLWHKRYNAGYTDDLPHKPDILFLSPDFNQLKVRGFVIDKIHRVGTLVNKVNRGVAKNQRLLYDSWCWGVAKVVYGDYKKALEAHSRTIIADRWDHVRRMLSRGGNADGRSVPDLMNVYVAWIKSLQDGFKPDAEFVEMEEAVGMFEEFCKITILRCYISTEGGRVGLAPHAAKTGDLVCIFYGADTPYIVRRTEDGSNVVLVGDAYVHGLMYGEALTMAPSAERGPDEEFVIE
ncbi:heterokaryon incompatibility protein-domain-containing protein [Aspergillus taichungensis]|uniref:Heterokaryon incompatibility protein-domain-containing protein n=1 Tax=Aspergillus taichungensis TaxID=482145 RepID=A0A2J5HMF3_9EURO|nr:heterokaryon incompatibility protein-domain-containing protein [Aspergillus taichungensis]